MVQLKYFFIAILLVGYHQQACKAGESGIPKDFMKWAGITIKLGVEIAKGNPAGIAKALVSGAKEIINMQKKDEADPKELGEKIDELSNNLNSLKVDLTNVKSEIIDVLTSTIPEVTELKNCLKEISRIISFVEGKYTDYIAYMRNISDYESDTLEGFAKSITSQGINGLPHLLKTLHESFYLKNDEVSQDTVLSLLSGNKLIATNSMCQRKQSLQQMLYILRNTIILADVKGVAMIQAAYEFKASLLDKDGGYKAEKGRAEELFHDRMNVLLDKVKSALKHSSRRVWTCDSTYTEGDTYTKLDNVFRSYILNEQSLNFINTCVSSCEATYTKNETHDCKEDLCRKQKPRDGYLSDCKKISEPAFICLSSSESNRIYDHIELGESKQSCQNTLVKAKAWKVMIFDSCDYCECTLDSVENLKSDRFVNLMPVVADVQDNYVVTGLRFVKENHILHIQIKQGKIYPGGMIDPSTNDWKSIIAYEIDKPLPGKDYYAVENIDYHKLQYGVENKDWNFSRYGIVTGAAINLDDVDLSDLSEEEKKVFNELLNSENRDWGDMHPSDYHLVTGLRITKNKVKNSGYHLNLELYMTPYNFTSGELYVDKTFTHSKFNHFSKDKGFVYKTEENVADKSEINLENLDLPINTEAPSKPTSSNNQFLKFTTSSLKGDAGQSTIPFIDLTSVETNPPVPLAGAGFMHKSSLGTGGFLSLKLITFDVEPYMKSNVE